MPSWLPPVLLSIVGTALSLIAAYFIARSAAKKWAAAGGEAAQTKLNEVLQDNAAAYEKALIRRDEVIKELREDFAKCKSLLDDLVARDGTWRRERRALKQEVSDLHAEVRELQGKGPA